MASATSVSSVLHARSKATCVSVGSSVGSFRREPGGDNVAGVSQVGLVWSSGTSSGFSLHNANNLLSPGTIAEVASPSFSETSRADFNRASTTTALGSRASTVATSRGTDAARKDSIVRAARELGPRQVEEELQDLRWEVDALRHERDSLVAEREEVLSCRTPPWPSWA